MKHDLLISYPPVQRSSERTRLHRALRAALATMASRRYVARPGTFERGTREPRVRYAHLAKAAMDFVAAFIEPSTDVLSMQLRECHGAIALRGHAVLHGLDQRTAVLFGGRFHPGPILLGVLRHAVLRFLKFARVFQSPTSWS